MTLGVIILLVGSLILSRLTSRGSRVSVRMRRRLMSSVNGRMVNPQQMVSRPRRTGESFWGWHQRLDGPRESVLLHGCSQSGECSTAISRCGAATGGRQTVGRVVTRINHNHRTHWYE